MYTGDYQICAFGQEVEYGVPVAPYSAIGIVTGGAVFEGTKVAKYFGPESNVISSQYYGLIECGGVAHLIVQELSILNWALQRPMISCTLDCGWVATPLRLFGSKVNSIDIVFESGGVVEADISWISKQATEGASFVWSPPDTPIWQVKYSALLYNGVSFDEFERVNISVNNNLVPIYTANRQNTIPRTLSRLAEGNYDAQATVEVYDKVINPCREIVPLHGASGWQLQISLEDVCAGRIAIFYVNNCFQSKVEEKFVPGDFVPTTFQLSGSNVTLEGT